MRQILIPLILSLSSLSSLHAIPMSFATTSSSNYGGAISDWEFSNTPEKAVLSGFQLLVNSSFASDWIEMRFTQPVQYSLAANAIAFLAEGSSMFFYDRLEVWPLMEPPYPQLYGKSASMAGSGFHATSLPLGSGIFEPGPILFTVGSNLAGAGIAFSDFVLTITPVSVPEMGSSLILLGMGLLAVLGFKPRKAK
jgi:energy-converting hydrogenase Eha subunit E